MTSALPAAPRIRLATDDAEIAACFPVMSELRPHLVEAEFVALVRRLGDVAGLELAYLDDGAGVRAVAGFRISEWLAGGRYLEIEDLVTTAGSRSAGHGGELFDWVVSHARASGCRQVRLVSRTTRLDAHRFYLRKGMALEAHYFSLNL